MNELIVLSARKCDKKHQAVSYNTILGLENEFKNICGAPIVLLSNKIDGINRICNKIFKRRLLVDNRAVFKIGKAESTSKVFFAAMGIGALEKYKVTLKKLRDKLVIYIFDCWEPQWGWVKELLDEIEPWAVCFAYIKAKEFFSKYYKRCYFLPQSMDASFFHEYPTVKTRLFMQMGRRTEVLHNMVQEYLKERNIDDTKENYVYEREKGGIIFPDTGTLAQEISKTRFFIVAPQNIENKVKTGNISEVTARFYEAMACKTLIVGFKPKDSFDSLFPFEEAMIEVNQENFSSKIEDLVKNEENYNRIVERNYHYVMTNHRWSNRYKYLIEKINEELMK